MTLPKVQCLTIEQQARLDAELIARNLTSLSAMRRNPSGLVAAWQAMLNADVQCVLAAYGDYEAQAQEDALNLASIRAIGETPFTREPRTGKRIHTRQESRDNEEEADNG